MVSGALGEVGGLANWLEIIANKCGLEPVLIQNLQEKGTRAPVIPQNQKTAYIKNVVNVLFWVVNQNTIQIL